MALIKPKKERVHGRLILKSDQQSKVEGYQILLAFVPAQPGAPPLKKLFEPHIAGSCNVLTLNKLDYELELEPGHYQLFARCHRAAIDGPRLKIDPAFADATPLAKAIEVRKGAPLLLNLPLTVPKAEAPAPAPGAPDGGGPPLGSPFSSAPRAAPSAPGGAPAAPAAPKGSLAALNPWSQSAKAVALVWATDDRIHVHPWRARPGAEDRLNAQVPSNSRRAFEFAQQHMAEGRVDRALSGYRQALDSFDQGLHATLPEWLFQLRLAIARCLLDSAGVKEALALLSPHLARGKATVLPLPLAVDLLGTLATALAISSDLEVVERLTIQLLAMVLKGEGPRDDLATRTAVDYRRRVLQSFVSRAEPERLLEYLDKETPLLGDPAGQLAGGMARFNALVKLGRGGAASTFGKKLLYNLEHEGSPEAQAALGTLRRELRDLMPGGDPNLIHSGASARRPAEVALGEKLIAAASQGRIDVLTALAKDAPGKLDSGAQGFRTALMAAAAAGQAAAARWLVEHGARVPLTASDSRSALHLAAEAGHVEVLTFLLSKGAAIDGRDGLLHTPLHLAAAGNRSSAVLTLLQHRAALDARDVSGDTPLSLAAWKGGAETIPMLVSAGADPNGRGDDGVTALMKAARVGQVKAVEALLQAGADKTLQDDGGHTAMDWATRAQQAAAARLLA